MKHSYIVIRPINPEAPMHGRNCEVILDGKRLENVADVTFKIGAGNISELNMTMVGATVEIRGRFFEGREPTDVPMNQMAKELQSETDPATGKEPF